MRIREWHEARLKNNPTYAQAVAEGAIANEMANRAVALRIAAGLSQKELAARARTTQATISRLETGEGNLTLDTLDRIFAVLDAAQPSVSLVELSAEMVQIFPAGQNSAAGSGTASFDRPSGTLIFIDSGTFTLPSGCVRGTGRSFNLPIPYAA